MKVLLAFLVISLAGVYPAASLANSPNDFASGAGYIEQYTAHASAQFAFTAHNGLSGATGRMDVKFTYDDGTPTEQYTASVDCLLVDGNTATLSGTITRVMNPTTGLQPGDSLTFTVQDNGAVPDQFGATQTSDCVPFPQFMRPIDRGNINVNEGDPL